MVARWDNGHFVFKNRLTITVTDGSGAVIGEGQAGSVAVFGKGGLPWVRQLNRVIHCSDGSLENIHLGFTIDENGDVHFH